MSPCTIRPLTVEISKKDITNDEELPGAELTITDSEGNEVEKWTSTDEPHRFQLPEGEYTLTEERPRMVTQRRRVSSLP